MSVKSLIGSFLACSVVVIILILIQSFLVPFVYTIKEPFFAMPVELGKKVKTPEDLPIRNDAYGEGKFGAKRSGDRKHTGLDLAAEIARPVYASKSGRAKTHYAHSGYGNLVIINHPGGRWQTRYGHLLKSAIKQSQWVRQGDIIGFVGKTGNANSKDIIPHLHFEIRHEGKPLDPAEFLAQNVSGK